MHCWCKGSQKVVDLINFIKRNETKNANALFIYVWQLLHFNIDEVPPTVVAAYPIQGGKN